MSKHIPFHTTTDQQLALFDHFKNLVGFSCYGINHDWLVKVMKLAHFDQGVYELVEILVEDLQCGHQQLAKICVQDLNNSLRDYGVQK